MLWGGERIPIRRGFVRPIAIAVIVSLVVLGGRWAYGYFYEADLFPSGSGYSETDTGSCHLGQALYFGYPVVPDSPVRLTGAQLLDVPPSVTVEGIWAVNGGPMMMGFGQADWDKAGIPKRMYPLSAISMGVDTDAGWWLAVKIVPHSRGRILLPGMRYSYTDGWRSGSSFAPIRVGLDCTA